MKITKILLLCVFTLLFVCNCRSTKGISSSEKRMENKKEIPTNVSTSNQFRALWYDFKEESNNFKTDNFTPSEKLINTYNLRLQNGEYYFSGFLTVTDDFEKKIFTHLGGSLVSYTSELYSFRFPLKNITELVNIKGIKRIELSISTQKMNFNED